MSSLTSTSYSSIISSFFFFNDTATTEIYTFPYTTLFRSNNKAARQALLYAVDQQKYMQAVIRSEEHTSELQSRLHLVCRLLLEKKKKPATRRFIKTQKPTRTWVSHSDHSRRCYGDRTGLL